MSWAAGRETKREEDAIYSLLGLFDVHMPPIYGEGKANAFDRLELEMQRKLALDSSRKRTAEEAFETTLQEGSNSKLKQSASDRAQEHSVAMQDWWAEAMARNMGTPRGYAKVAVLLLRWADELDDLRTSVEINWYKTEDYLRSDEIDGDVLAILDATYASNGNTGHVPEDVSNSNYRDQETTRRFQLMNGCGQIPPGRLSFTRRLIDGLKELHERTNNSAFSTQDLHQCIEMRPPGTSPELWSLLPDKRHIPLTPMVQLGLDARVPQQHRKRPGRGYLKLGLEIRDASLEQEQVDYLAKVLSRALDKQFIGLRGIDWLGFERREKEFISFSENLALKLRQRGKQEVPLPFIKPFFRSRVKFSESELVSGVN
ncbi:uncharacterized protein J4E79_009617 [Alternaria viburni]|uniref:uncharacterized protein n=1 Tax=Alternaria viburni TaxID=566460 RepID=UPI0020C1DE73|nr:uncharacterized protein J4E79_009617 [Alternaria viburni]KAI4649772.1 hypothetical protein J4E79_009617 [Alternaria viburni]